MRTWIFGVVALVLAVGACEDDGVIFVDEPDSPRNLQAAYFGGAVKLTWELGPAWNGESFRIYGKRVNDSAYFLVAEVTNCVSGVCSYEDVNVVAGVSYEYYVASVDPDTGVETPSAYAVEVFVSDAVAPPIPTGALAIALDNAVYIIWNDDAAGSDDFSHYRIYIEAADGDLLLGETDSPGFLDLLAQNGTTSSYFVTSVDDQGHESAGGNSAEATPRPDFSGELIYVHQDVPSSSGFRFQPSEDIEAVMSGDDGDRHFRVEADGAGYWFVSSAGNRIFPSGQFTTALKCGVAADATCSSWEAAPTGGYTTQDVAIDPELTYMFQVVGDDNQLHYGAVRVALIGQDQNGDEFIVVDWAYQTQAGNPNLSPADNVPVS